MKLLQTLVSSVGFRDPANNPQRLALLDRLLAVAADERAGLVVLPGGYLTVRTEPEVVTAVGEVRRRAEVANVAVIGGVDLPPPSADDPKQAVRQKGDPTGELPYYGFAVCPVADDVRPVGLWRQTSSTGANAWDVPDEDVPGADRVVGVGPLRVGVLVCGELFSSPARGSMAALGPGLVVDLGHLSMGTGVTRAMENIARNGRCAVAHCQHVQWWGASHHFVAADGVRHSTPTDEARYVGGEDDAWVAWCVRTV